MSAPEWDEMWSLLDTFDKRELRAVQKVVKYVYEMAGTEDNSTSMNNAFEAERQIRAVNIALKELLGGSGDFN